VATESRATSRYRHGMEVKGRVAVVTGGGSGIGRVLVAGFARAGATVLVADRDEGLARRAAAELSDQGLLAIPWEVDVTDDEQCERLVARAVELGGPHVLVNNAGGWSAGPDQFPIAGPAAWSAAIDLNLRAPMLLTQLCRPAMSVGGGVVIMLASSAGLGAEPYGSPEYAATKAGLIRFTTAMGGNAGTAGQRLACVVPDWVGLPRAHDELAALPASQRAALPPLIPPEDVLDAVLALVTDDSASGTVVTLVGGEPPRRLR
jgi:NAD(P)-dependent dehydrogenase (short-subunit alcohol dehydrogenase family)